MNEIRASWEKVLHPEALRSNIITASIFSIAFEMLKASIIEKIEMFYLDGFGESGASISQDYKEEVLSLNKSPLYASLIWLEQRGAIDADDREIFERLKRHRNTLAHEILKFASEGVPFDVAESLGDMISLLNKIEIWWIENLDMAIIPDAYPADLDLDQVIPGPVWSLKMLMDVALGPEEEAKKYYDYLISLNSQG